MDYDDTTSEQSQKLVLSLTTSYEILLVKVVHVYNGKLAEKIKALKIAQEECSCALKSSSLKSSCTLQSLLLTSFI